ncbi:hypothetical protein A2397_02780 [Candidatus Amesbacteria bacterium RIFOXYB1_FULL_44_23]|uniref:Pyridoxamine 5'-phosphate oxidase N-terminal domain-containing protein n=1 Tax=Candidatus Amesbacteria bacterium RIFOXYB1_FULL_44_23 TaxID=1797263 RepID=A0A1F4ZW20_9BACT|nr:MAG: hypothetical protein A2397_02780 [Candidatus Amesbacteria bacterium RIFOXYB1_FULL_44_23]
MRTKDQIRDDIAGFLKENGIMTLASCADNQPWVCTLYYGIDESLNLYIVTGSDTEHGKQLTKNSKVAFNIFDSRQKITEPKRGVQGKGKMEIVKGVVEIGKALLLWHLANPGIESKITVADAIKKLSDTKIYKITPKYLKFFNKELYKPDEYGIVEL